MIYYLKGSMQMKKTYRTFSRFALTLVLLVSQAAWADGAITLPTACTTNCISPYGELLGSAEGTQAYSNCNSDCVVFEPNRERGTYTGIKWQCVEFARRWLVQNRGLTYGDVDVAADIWRSIPHFTRLANGAQVPVDNHPNGSANVPQQGDLLVYAREYLGTGHVAVVVTAEPSKGYITVAEQNFDNRKWLGNHARKIELLEKNGRYWLLDAYLLGWKRQRMAAP